MVVFPGQMFDVEDRKIIAGSLGFEKIRTTDKSKLKSSFSGDIISYKNMGPKQRMDVDIILSPWTIN